ncbi:MAG TPA: GTPase HflX, partial [Polyangiales bacterium]|nr:GTPase HflX [Polyangiales bacterium]
MSSSSTVRETEGPRPRAVLLAVQLPGVSDDEFEESLRELTRLAETLGLELIGRITQKRALLMAATVVGEGKLKELGAWTGGSGVVEAYAPLGKRARDEVEPDEDERDAAGDRSTHDGAGDRATIVLVDHDLTPNQTRNLEKATGAEVLDRAMVILSIFQRHARTREAKMQVEIARLTYLAPRLREANANQDRQRGGIGGKGAGESSLELDRRRIRDR